MLAAGNDGVAEKNASSPVYCSRRRSGLAFFYRSLNSSFRAARPSQPCIGLWGSWHHLIAMAIS
jgi:hypothetical protein